MKKNNNLGFTLIELLVAITIVAILATIGFTVYNDSQKLARDAKRREDISAISKALEQYKTANGKYPTGCVWSSYPNWTAELCGLAGYIKSLPKDPINNDPGNCESSGAGDTCHIYHYCTDPDGSYFVVGVNTEKAKDEGNPPNSCTLAGAHRIWINNQQ